MNHREIVNNFLLKYNQHPDDIDIDSLTKTFVEEMRLGLAGKPSSLMMIPAYVSTKGEVPLNETVIAIDAGGTNLRIAHVTFTEEGIVIENLKKQRMLGVEKPLHISEFFSQLTDILMPYLDKSQKIGFCFSFAAEIQPDRDGKILEFSKEINIADCQGKLIFKELKKEIKKRGFEKEISGVILNDTVSTLLGGPAIKPSEKVDGQIGLILGTGTNTAYIEELKNITKLDLKSDGKMIINMESAGFNKVPQGKFDKIIDDNSADPAGHIFEKMISGIYLGNVICETVKHATKENLFSKESAVEELPYFSMVEVDQFLREPYGDNLLAKACHNNDDVELLYNFADLAIERASKLVTVNLAADMIQMDGGKKMSTPCRIVIEGSTYHKCYSYKEKIDRYMKEYVNDKLNRYYMVTSGDDTNLAGSAIAALLNC
ncbi:MAG: hexokinase [Bacillota bacterium]|nr:hexokinase [Bacillota bacterium]NLL25921.1 hexokinase [Erysipelotrichia bacterium]